ncbi:MAG: SRPBCC domain-containing protein [Acidobacteriia bacterium]|nr:SRPBCC domain-containing protein [Terriglobia bacterium]
MAKFELVEQGAGSKIVFNHTGFPQDEVEHLAAGWKTHYWEPLAKLLDLVLRALGNANGARYT